MPRNGGRFRESITHLHPIIQVHPLQVHLLEVLPNQFKLLGNVVANNGDRKPNFSSVFNQEYARFSSLYNPELGFGCGGRPCGRGVLGEFPSPERGAHRLSAEPEQGTHVDKRKYVFGVVGDDPRLHFLKLLSLSRLPGMDKHVKRPDRIEQERF